jgi:two-component system copper resistance phosphate regulon response regulator CusR
VRILVVEDEKKLASALRDSLEAENYSVSMANSGEEGYFLAHSEPFDLLVMDVMLPGRNGLEILKTLRREGDSRPVLLLTAKDAIEDRVRGLDAGADDYLVKPFALAELLARIRVILRRGNPEPAQDLRIADLAIDAASRSVTRAGDSIDLTPREFDLLEYLLRNQGRVVSREMLAKDVWKETARYSPIDNVIDVHIARLRRKVDNLYAKKLLQTVRGVGFVLRDPERK